MTGTATPTNSAATMSSHTETQREQLGKALGRLASGVYIVTINVEGQPHGLLATWVSQASFEPAAITLSFNKERPIVKSIEPGTMLTLNVLSKKNMDIFKAFARPSKEAHDDRFEGLPLKENDKGGPIFAHAASYLNCRVTGSMEAGDHIVVLAELIDGAILESDSEPMVHIRNNGFHY
jgi:flavin reductase (DIM6/NTAB) family NADH-FMN oxidoreductase RutF